MALDATQRATLAAHICANTDPEVIAALAIRNDRELARLYNLPSSFIVWKESVTPAEYKEAIVWSEVDTLNAGAARIWEWVTQNMTAPIDASSVNVRQGIADAFGANTVTRGNLITVGKEPASLVESIFATGTGTDASPGTRTVVGDVSVLDVSLALTHNPCA